LRSRALAYYIWLLLNFHYKNIGDLVEKHIKQMNLLLFEEMSVDLALISVIIAVLNVVLTITLLLGYKRLANDLPHALPELIQRALTEVAPTIETAIEQGLSQGLKSVAGSVLAGNSAISRQMKALEKDVIADGIDQVIPGGGAFAAKYIQKYPFLLTLLNQFAQGRQNSNPLTLTPSHRSGGQMT